MSVKSIAKKAGSYIITTINGSKTTTGTFYTKVLKEYTPLPNGFNAMLADDVVKIITEHKELWDQNVWRRVFTTEAQDDYIVGAGETVAQVAEQVRGMLAFEQDQNSPVCGTAMCFAGWVAELTGADWVIDSAAVRAMSKGKLSKYEMDRHADQLLIPYNDGIHGSISNWHVVYSMSEELSTLLVKRGFSPATHRLGVVHDYASYQLGGIDGSPLFEENNDLDAITKIINDHVEFGPTWYADQEEEDDEDDDTDQG